MTEREYLVLIYSYPHFGPKRTSLLVDYFKSAKKVWNARYEELKNLGLSDKISKDFLDYRKNFDIKKYFDELENLKINYLTKSDEEYPENLRGLVDAPLVLYFRGCIKKTDRNSLAIVGSRKVTSYGREVAMKLTSELVSYGITIVSGLAYGVDTIAHKVCIDAGGRTLAVLASGLDMITPRGNLWLSNEIIESGGALISEKPLGHNVFRVDFPERNRIISGLSKGVLVIEGTKNSGALYTASHAAEQGKQVFAVPGPITSVLSEAPHYLIQNGAKLVTSSKDILSELGLEAQVNYEQMEEVLPQGEEELKIISILEAEPLHIDEIVRMSSLPSDVVLSKLTIMEIKGMVRNIGGGVYKKL